LTRLHRPVGDTGELEPDTDAAGRLEEMGGHQTRHEGYQLATRDDQVSETAPAGEIFIAVDRVLVSGYGGESPGFIGAYQDLAVEPLTDGYILHTGISPSFFRSCRGEGCLS
jgi:hypothetical protein